MSDLGCKICEMPPVNRITYLNHLLGKKHRKIARQRDFSKDNTFSKRTLKITGIRQIETLGFDIANKYLKYDLVDVEFEGKFAYAEFPSEKLALEAYKDKFKVKGVLKVERVTWDRHAGRKNAGFIQTNCEIKAPDISPQLQSLLRSPTNKFHTDDLIIRLVKEIELNPADKQDREKVRFLVQSFLQPLFPGALTFLFGSSENNLGFKGCDVDMVANLQVNCWEGKSKGEAEKDADQLTKYLARHLRKSNFAYNVFGIGRARVPIVKFNCKFGGIHVDLSFKNGMPLYNTNLIKLYTNTHSIVRPYLMCIRYWAKLQGLTGGGVPNSLLTNYCLCMLMLFYLMVRKPPIVPPVGELQEDMVDYVYIDDCICNFKTDVDSWKSRYHETTLINLTYEFFQFYSDFDYNEYVISPLQGALIPKIDVRRRWPSFPQKYLKFFYQNHKNISLQIDTALCVQDPFDIMHNIARGYSKDALEIFKQKCKIAARICEEIKSGIKTLSSLFEFYKINDHIVDITIDSSSDKNKDVECDIVSIASEDSVELLHELESLERAGGVGALFRQNAKLSEDSGCEVNGSSESVNGSVVVDGPTEIKESKEPSEDEDITFIGRIIVEDKIETVEVVNLEDTSEKVAKETSNKTSSENASNGTLEDSSKVKNGSSPFIIDIDSVESTKPTVDSSEEDSICVIEDIIGSGDCINPSKEPFNFTINYSSNCSYDILDDGSLRPRKRGHVNSSSKEKFVSDLVLFILKESMKCNILKVDTYIDGSDEYNLKDFRKRSIVQDPCPQKIQKINTNEGKIVKSDFTLLSSFKCQPLYRVWVNRKKMHKELKIPLVNPLQVEMFISNKIAEKESVMLSKKCVVVKLWKDATKPNIFWVSLREENKEELGKNIVSVFNDLFHKITTNIFSQIDDFLKWS